MNDGRDGNVLCITCRYAHRSEEPDADGWADYECHRHAPCMVPVGDGDIASAWPAVSGFDWCGDHQEARA